MAEIGRATTPRFTCETIYNINTDIAVFELTIKCGSVVITKDLSNMTIDTDYTMHVDLTQAETLSLRDKIAYQYHYRLKAEDGGTGGLTISSNIFWINVRDLLSGVII